MRPQDERIHTYLWHGYLPPADVPEWFPLLVEQRPTDAGYTASEAAECLDALFDRLVSETPGPYVVPISGGWDSRLILAALRERTDKILTVTLGAKGQWDYELGACVAEAAGVEHLPVSLKDMKLEWKALEDAARRAPWTYLPDALFLSHTYRKALNQVGTGASIWSGFLGETLTGGHFHPNCDHESTISARERFQQGQRRMPAMHCAPSRQLPRYQARPDTCPSCMSEGEFLDLNVRQRGCIAGIVLGKAWEGWTAGQGEFEKGVQVVAPFADAQWGAYWLNAPRRYHKGQALYRRMAETRFPELFAIPSKNTWGHKRNQRGRQGLARLFHGARNRLHRRFPLLPVRSRLMDNYLDFHQAFRKRDDYITAMETAIDVLKQRETTPWLDIDHLWAEHYRGKRDHAQALQVLLGLAVNLEANT
jgi:hypothetical protein